MEQGKYPVEISLAQNDNRSELSRSVVDLLVTHHDCAEFVDDLRYVGERTTKEVRDLLDFEDMLAKILERMCRLEREIRLRISQLEVAEPEAAEKVMKQALEQGIVLTDVE